MGKAAVLQAVVDFLDPSQGSNITYLSTVYAALPKVANEDDLFQLQPPGSGIGAVVYVFIEGHHEWLEELVGIRNDGLGKLRAYTVGLLCILKSDLETALEGQTAFDEFMDSLLARIQSSRTAGDAGVIWQWGLGDTHNPMDLRFDYPVPRQARGGVMLYQAVGRVTALEWQT